MIDDLYLLRRAWPAGYLPMRGVFTVGGWTRGGPAPTVWWVQNGAMAFTGEGSPHFAELRALGALLPVVDPAETATWACLLHDLATAAYGDVDPRFPILFKRVLNTHWSLIARRLKKCRAQSIKWKETTDDPALALVRIRAQMRENKK